MGELGSADEGIGFPIGHGERDPLSIASPGFFDPGARNDRGLDCPSMYEGVGGRADEGRSWQQKGWHAIWR
ncbi:MULTISPECIES: hypothetical protein [Methylobacteriaceae]|uniref:hypothetical protein n=1 Tax=Methylobacteriaceae TaxID=119045 RepID=UPI0015E8B259|nr:hypothetical protein [Methylobacterium sp. B4]